MCSCLEEAGFSTLEEELLCEEEVGFSALEEAAEEAGFSTLEELPVLSEVPFEEEEAGFSSLEEAGLHGSPFFLHPQNCRKRLFRLFLSL